MTEIIYIVRNPGFPDFIKIGKTNNLEDRIRNLSYHAGVPFAFEVLYACTVKDADEVERILHNAFGDHRINPRREFFKLNPERVIPILKYIKVDDITPNSDEFVQDEEDRKSMEKELSRMSPIRFSSLGIPEGSTLTFVRDESIQAIVVDDRNIEFEGEVTSLSQAATKILNRDFNVNWQSARGPDFWVYEGETLSERRMRLENED